MCDYVVGADSAWSEHYHVDPAKTCIRQTCRKYIRLSVLAIVLLAVFITIHHLSNVKLHQPFSSPFTDDDLRSLNLTLSTVLDVLNQLNTTYFMTGGTLLGSYRHHGRVPWDDHVDLMLNSSDEGPIWISLTKLIPDYGLFVSGYMDNPYPWKVYPRRHGRWVPFRPFRWPFVDLQFFVSNVTHLCNGSPSNLDQCWPRSSLFPLRLRPFGRFQIPAPCDTESALSVEYRNIKVCVSPTYPHIALPWRRQVAVWCFLLADSHPMVVRYSPSANHTVIESLMLGNRTLYTIIVQNGC